jgi:hypothetical protein
MKAGRTYLIILITGTLSVSCIDRYYLNSEGNTDVRIVIEGLLTNGGESAEIVISKPSSPDNFKFLPISGCNVYIEDSQNNSVALPESAQAGHYQAQLDPLFVQVGNCYRLNVKTPGGRHYLSAFEEMKPCPKVDSVYYEIETKPKNTIGEVEEGIQFYINFKGDNTMDHYFRWSLQETYEYHSTWSINRYIDEKNKLIVIPEDFSNFVCYKTEPIYEIYNLSTSGLSKNSYDRYPLHFVNNETQRLLYHYSLLVRQYSLSEDAYTFWESLRKNNKELNYLLGAQPSVLKSNIYNTSDSTETVLGYFGVSSVTKKRINIRFIPGLTFSKVKYCPEVRKLYTTTERPLYLFPLHNSDGTVSWEWSDRNCFFCQMLGGTTERPSYWDEK